MVCKKIIALKDFTLRTTLKREYLLTMDQVEVVEFGSELEFQQLLALGKFVEAEISAQVEKPILVLHPPKVHVEDMVVPEVHTHAYLPECDLECGVQGVIDFHKCVRAEE